MFTIANDISYDGLMVQGNDKYGKTGWFDIRGNDEDKYVEEQGDFLVSKITELAQVNPDILNKNKKDEIFVIGKFQVQVSHLN
ncbi:hypothetical protein SY212_21500 [Ligilactobacillus agilis]|uniref:Uncharacterized protein n=1 Tax=Ligilactobacillus agilis TaxID=1601 RepID=A0A6F9XPN2_9LACO|nr:hypothetical protein [Ligilactobacillus agilis]GET07120.1 hypothetical protein SY212_21500 [Ligilactobacillus agilis]